MRFFLLSGLFITLLAACTPGNDEQEATADALRDAIVMTATARAIDEISPEDELATVEAEATEAAVTLAAVSTEGAATATAASAAATATRESLLSTAIAATAMVATAQAAAPPPTAAGPPPTPQPAGPPVSPAEREAITAEVAGYGVDPAAGHLAWIHPPVMLDVEGFQQYGITNTVGLQPVANFVLAADITWTTEFGDAGCGYVLRSTNLTPDSSQYLLFITRRDSGHAIFQTRFGGDFLNEEVVDLPISGVDPAFQWPNGSTNRLAVVARADNFTVFLNGTPLGNAQPTTKFGEGLVAFVALSDSGQTICTFENGWLWQLD